MVGTLLGQISLNAVFPAQEPRVNVHQLFVWPDSTPVNDASVVLAGLPEQVSRYSRRTVAGE
jgi:hypothetical protein